MILGLRSVSAILKFKPAVLFFGSLALALILHGAVPFVSLPTLGQAVWTTGFSQSFVNDSIISIHANNFGVPKPAAIAFGLAGAYPAGLFIAAGLHPADAYSLMCALWLSVAFFGAWQIGLMFGLRQSLAVFMALLWMSMPIIWNHASYSMVSLGIGLLPFYFWPTLSLFMFPATRWNDIVKTGVLYLLVCLLAVFMDGYSFMMFAVGANLIGLYVLIRCRELRRHILCFAFPLHVACFAIAFLLYVLYIGSTTFPLDSLEVFRAWGVDLTYLVIPTTGVHWFWDLLGLSMVRSVPHQFGDTSVWTTTFTLPLIIAGLVAWSCARRKSWLATGFVAMAFVGFYLSLGPSLKVNSLRTDDMIKAGIPPYYNMPSTAAICPTGSTLLSENVPGFKHMRASYRWLALGGFGFWALIALLSSVARTERDKAIIAALIATLILSNLPHPVQKWQTNTDYRSAFFAIDADILTDMKACVRTGELVAFLPFRNDFLVNYLAARLNVRTYNIGGDKNLRVARKHWPQTMQGFQQGQIDRSFKDRVLTLLIRQEADAVVLPYIDFCEAAHDWPAPIKLFDAVKLMIVELRASEFVDIDERKYYAIVRIRPQFKLEYNRMNSINNANL